MAMVLENPSLQERLRAVARPGESPETLLETIVEEGIARREREAARWEAARIQAQIDLMGPHRSHEASMAELYRRLGISEPSACTLEELEAEGEAILDSLPPEKIAEMERLGLL